MNIDRFVTSMGLLRFENTDDVREILVAIARQFLSIGGTLSLAEWESLSEETRSAFAEAAREHRREVFSDLAAALAGAPRAGDDAIPEDPDLAARRAVEILADAGERAAGGGGA